MSTSFRFVAVVAVTLLLAACGGDENGGGAKKTGGGDGGGGGATTLTTVDNAFQPSALTASSGADLEITNEGQSVHNLSIEGSDVSQDIETGQSTTVVVDVDPGEYTMFCEYHRASGMEGVLTVE